MRLFNVTIETTIVVVAEDADDAAGEALDAIRDIDHDAWSAIVADHKQLPSNWTAECIPYGHCVPTDRDRTIAGWSKVLS